MGFAPDLVIIKGNTNQSVCFKSTSLSGDNTLKLPSQAVAYSDAIQSLDSDGFTIGTHASVNTDAVIYYWMAFKEAAGNFLESSYTGDAVDGRSITGVGFQPQYIFIKGNDNLQAAWRDNAESGDTSYAYQAELYGTNLIQSLDTDGFTLGDSAYVNNNGKTFYYAAFRSETGIFTTGTYTGNGSDDRSITGIGFQPTIVFVKKRPGGTEAIAVARTSSLPSGESLYLGTDAVNLTNAIQTLESDGFQVGTAAEVNTNGVVYHYAAWKATSSGGTTTSTSTSTSTSTTTSTSTSTTSTSTSTTSTSTSTTSTSTSTTSTSTSTSTTSTSTSTTSTSTSSSTSTSTSTSTTTTLQYVFSVEEAT